ncbi:MAG: HAMP domain-containing histidine kinase [Eubacterium sp.]|nr:HAMP domain-containing histidine kinase [Eubacterium sp.]
MPRIGQKKKLHKLRDAIEHGDLTQMQEEMLKEGEIGKLANAILTREKEQQAALEKERRQKEYLRDLISDISHQLKTPISSLTVFTDLLIREAERDLEEQDVRSQTAESDSGSSSESVGKRLRLLHTEEEQLERMTWLTQALLQLARLEADCVSFAREPVQLRSLCAEVRSSFLSMAEERGISINITGVDAELRTDPDWLREAIGNVVKNAIEYSPEEGTVEIGIEQTPLATRIFVKDEGDGIPEKDRLRVFERFYRVNGNTVNPSSVGIGLALSKKITAGCGGRLYVQSRHIAECERREKPYTRMVFDFQT